MKHFRGVCRVLAAAAGAVALLLSATSARALPSFARQTGMECTTCHLSWPELTTVGRQFKLGGYTLLRQDFQGERPLVSFSYDSNPPLLPLAAFVQVSLTRTADTRGDSADFPRQNEVVLQQASLFWAGRIAEHAGAFAQWSYDGVAHHSAIDNVDLRFAGRYRSDALDLMYGASINNSPTMSDIYQTTPTWGFPFSSSPVAVTPAAATLIEGGLDQQVAGLSVYSMWNRTVYAEVGGYRTADKAFSVLRAGTDRTEDAALDGVAPYWRLALQHEWDQGMHSAMIGTYGLNARKFPDNQNPSGPTDRFHDIGIDAQYQYITDAHRVGAQVSYVRERQEWNASFAPDGSGTANASDTLRSVRAKLTYYRDTKYGVTLGAFRVTGDADSGLYAADPITGSANGSPDTSGYVVEFDWLPRRDRRFVLQYTAYTKFNGASTNYDGNGRNARDNNTWYLLAWFPF